MYHDSSILKKRKKSPSNVIGEYSEEGDYFIYHCVDETPLNAFISRIMIEIDEKCEFQIMFLEKTNGIIEMVCTEKLNKIIKNRTSDIYVTNEGYIIIYCNDCLVVTLDFNKFNFIKVSELYKITHFVCGEIYEIKNNNVIIFTYDGKIQKVPFAIRTNLFDPEVVFWLELLK